MVMRTLMLLILLLPAAIRAADCAQLESSFAQLDSQFRSAKNIPSPSERYDYYYRYIAAGAEVMAYCRNDQRNYKYTEIVRKLRTAERERAGLQQLVIEEQWRINGIQPIVNIVYQECTYSY